MRYINRRWVNLHNQDVAVGVLLECLDSSPESVTNEIGGKTAPVQ